VERDRRAGSILNFRQVRHGGKRRPLGKTTGMN
jgi:hypothetical protein